MALMQGGSGCTPAATHLVSINAADDYGAASSTRPDLPALCDVSEALGLSEEDWNASDTAVLPDRGSRHPHGRRAARLMLTPRLGAQRGTVASLKREMSQLDDEIADLEAALRQVITASM